MFLRQLPFPRVLLTSVFLFSTSQTVLAQRVGLGHAKLHPDSKTADIVYIGDSITYGALLPDPETQAPPAVCTQLIQDRLPETNFFMSNQGRSGHTTVDVLPSSNLDFPAIEQAASQLSAAHPGLLIFSIMLGTNDSAESGPNGAPVSAEQYGNNLRAIISSLLLKFPRSIVILNRPSWYSPNTHNAAEYGKTGLARLQTYFPVIDSIVHSLSSTPDRVYEGDTTAFDFFAAHYRADLNPEQGHEGIFYLHPNIQGARALAQLWSSAIVHALELHGCTTSNHPKCPD